MRSTGSISRGRTAEAHNRRECYEHGHAPANVDPARTGRNVVLEDRELSDVYQECFGYACELYNTKQVERGHSERQIRDYLEKVKADKKLQPMYEFVVQLGNVDEHPDAATSEAVYRDWLAEFRRRWGGHFAVKQAVIHNDESVSHMHVELVPVAESKRGLSRQNSLNKAIRQCGFADYKAMLQGWDEALGEAMARHGVERVAGDRERQMGGVDVATYRRTMAALGGARRELSEARDGAEVARAEAESWGRLSRALGPSGDGADVPQEDGTVRHQQSVGQLVTQRETMRVAAEAQLELARRAREQAERDRETAAEELSQARREAAQARAEARKAQEAAKAAKGAQRAAEGVRDGLMSEVESLRDERDALAQDVGRLREVRDRLVAAIERVADKVYERVLGRWMTEELLPSDMERVTEQEVSAELDRRTGHGYRRMR